jgi:hypothetical protein
VTRSIDIFIDILAIPESKKSPEQGQD